MIQIASSFDKKFFEHRNKKDNKNNIMGAYKTKGDSKANVTQGKSRAPKEGDPGSTYEQVDKGNVISRT